MLRAASFALSSPVLSVPILNAERFLTGLVTQSMIISLISQVRNQKGWLEGEGD